MFSWLWWLLTGWRPSRPRKPRIKKFRLVWETREMLLYEIRIAPVSAESDVLERHLKVVVNGTEVGVVRYARETVKVGGLRFLDGDEVHLELRDVDDAGNASEPAILDFIAKDTIPPDAPEGFGVELIGEVSAAHVIAAAEGHSDAEGKPGAGTPAIEVLVAGSPLPGTEESHAALSSELTRE